MRNKSTSYGAKRFGLQEQVNEYTCEIFVDIAHEDGRNQEFSLGFLSALHDTCSGSFLHCCVMDRHADAIPGLAWRHGSIESALSSSHDFLVDLVNQ